MPSKGGSRTAGDAQPLTEVLAAVIRSAGANPGSGGAAAAAAPLPPLPDAELTRPLRQGVEVARFNELAARDPATLRAEESAELLRYRLRRALSSGRALDRMAHSWNENEIRDNLDRYRRRLNRLRELEETRGRPDQEPVAVDPGVEERALARLSTLAARGPNGLIAGEGAQPQAQPGFERIPALAFNPSAADVPLYILAPNSLPSDALAANVEALRQAGARVHLVHDAAEIPHGELPSLLLNWGSTQPIPAGWWSSTRRSRCASPQTRSRASAAYASSRRGLCSIMPTSGCWARTASSPSAVRDHAAAARHYLAPIPRAPTSPATTCTKSTSCATRRHLN